MPPLLAAVPDGTAAWLDSLQWLVTFVIGLALLWGKVFPSSQKREVSFTGTPADKKEFEAHVEVNRKDHDGLHSKIGGTERGLRTEMHNGLSALRDKVDKLAETVSALNATTGLQNGALAAIDSKVTKLLSESRHHPHPPHHAD
jgi:hypothetical protein